MPARSAIASAARLWHPKQMLEPCDPLFDETIDSYYRAIAARRFPDWLATLSSDVAVHEPAGAPPAEGHEGASEAWKMLTAPFRQLTFERTATFYSGSGAAVMWRCLAIGINGRRAASEGITVFEFDGEGLIQAVLSYWDPAALMIELAADDSEPRH